MATSTKPKLPQLKTPKTSTFPSEISALSARTPLSAFPDFIKSEDGIKTPITPPIAYTDFLKTMASPVTGEKLSGRSSPTSAPLSATSSEHSNCSCNCETHKEPTSAVVPSPFVYPSSAPASTRMKLRIPPSPAISNNDSPLSATSVVRSPFSARSPYDWDLNSKGRYFDIKSPKTPRSGVRHVREIVTRTVRYTPRMSPAPKGKRRKLDWLIRITIFPQKLFAVSPYNPFGSQFSFLRFDNTAVMRWLRCYEIFVHPTFSFTKKFINNVQWCYVSLARRSAWSIVWSMVMKGKIIMGGLFRIVYGSCGWQVGVWAYWKAYLQIPFIRSNEKPSQSLCRSAFPTWVINCTWLITK